jgi:hypothetical protein
LLVVAASFAPTLSAAEEPSVGFPAPTSRGLEGMLPTDIWVRLSEPSDEPVIVDYEVTGGSATAGKDYQFAEGTLTFAPKETKKSFEVAIIDDKLIEKNETVIFQLSKPTNAKLSERSAHTFTIMDKENLHIKVDFGLPKWDGNEHENMGTDEPVPGTVKEGWTPWVSPRWVQMYDNGGVQLEDVAGTGINMSMSTVRGGHMTLKVSGMIGGLAGRPGGPRGKPINDPICNSWIYNCDWNDIPWGDIILAMYNLPAGVYTLKSYHNHFYCQRIKGTDEPTLIDCTEVRDPQPPMPYISAMSLDRLLARYKDVPRWWNARPQFENAQPDTWDFHNQPGFPNERPLGKIGPGNITTHWAAVNTKCQQVKKDEELIPSTVKFETDGSAVHIVYQSGCCIADGVRKSRYDGARAILNAFELIYMGNKYIEEE